MGIDDIAVSRAIIENYSRKLLDALELDVAIAGCGPAGGYRPWTKSGRWW